MAGREITQPILVVCEGPSDCGLINALIRRHALSGIEAFCPGERNIGSMGFSAIPKFLEAVSSHSEWPNLKGFFLIVDANSDPADRFAKAADMLVPYNFHVTRPFELQGHNPARAVYLIPGPGRTGCLEHLLLDAIADKNPRLLTCVDSFADCVKLPQTWPSNDQAKMRVHALIAACCEEEPATALSRVWDRGGNPIPIDSPKFAGLVDLLRQFASL